MDINPDHTPPVDGIDDRDMPVNGIHDVPGDGTTVRYEERAVAGTETFVREVVRITKRVVTETVTVEVPLRREELVVERISGEGREVVPGVAGSQPDREIVLYAERPVVTTEAVPIEHVRIAVQIQGRDAQEQIALQREEIDVQTTEGVAAEEHPVHHGAGQPMADPTVDSPVPGDGANGDADPDNPLGLNRTKK